MRVVLLLFQIVENTWVHGAFMNCDFALFSSFRAEAFKSLKPKNVDFMLFSVQKQVNKRSSEDIPTYIQKTLIQFLNQTPKLIPSPLACFYTPALISTM